MSQTAQTAAAPIGMDIGTNSFRIVGYDELGALCCQKWLGGQVEADCQPAALGDRHGRLLKGYSYSISLRFAAVSQNALPFTSLEIFEASEMRTNVHARTLAVTRA